MSAKQTKGFRFPEEKLSQPQVVTEGYATTPTDLNRIYSAETNIKVARKKPATAIVNCALCIVNWKIPVRHCTLSDGFAATST